MISELEIIRKYELLNTSDIARILRVSRPTVYAWIGGEEPCPNNVLKLYRLAYNLKTIVDANISRAGNLIKRPLFDGLSIIDILERDEPISTDCIDKLKTIADKEDSARKKQKGFGKITSTVNQMSCNTAVYMCDY